MPLSKMGALRVSDRRSWVLAVKQAMRVHRHLGPAAEALGVKPATLRRWLDEAEFAKVERAAPGENISYNGGRPRKEGQAPKGGVP